MTYAGSARNLAHRKSCQSFLGHQLHCGASEFVPGYPFLSLWVRT